MSPEQQRRRHNTRFSKAFGKCRVTWNRDLAYIRPQAREFKGLTVWIRRAGWDWVMEVSTSGATFKNPNLSSLANQLKLVALLDS